mmetsp:Transcript_7010/g.12448  ORF Transcript_7010/g.12448 Transcript_7010/m.12448 type:complete len:82 (+) Transcript_7010:678-923(+)
MAEFLMIHPCYVVIPACWLIQALASQQHACCGMEAKEKVLNSFSECEQWGLEELAPALMLLKQAVQSNLPLLCQGLQEKHQ